MTSEKWRMTLGMFQMTCCHITDNVSDILCPVSSLHFVSGLQQSAVCIWYWPVGDACDNANLIFCPSAFLCPVYPVPYWTLGHIWYKPTFTTIALPHISLLFSFSTKKVCYVEFLGRLPLYICSQTPFLGSPFPVSHSQLFSGLKFFAHKMVILPVKYS